MTWMTEARTWFDLCRPEGLSGDGYAVVSRVAGSIRMAGASESLKFGASYAAGQFVVTLRQGPAIRSDWKLKTIDGRNLQVAGYGDPDGSGRYLQVLCQELQ